MIDVHPVEIQAVSQDGELLFNVKTVDEHCALVEMKCLVNSQNIDQLTAAMRRALAMLELEQ